MELLFPIQYDKLIMFPTPQGHILNNNNIRKSGEQLNNNNNYNDNNKNDNDNNIQNNQFKPTNQNYYLNPYHQQYSNYDLLLQYQKQQSQPLRYSLVPQHIYHPTYIPSQQPLHISEDYYSHSIQYQHIKQPIPIKNINPLSKLSNDFKGSLINDPLPNSISVSSKVSSPPPPTSLHQQQTSNIEPTLSSNVLISQQTSAQHSPSIGSSASSPVTSPNLTSSIKYFESFTLEESSSPPQSQNQGTLQSNSSYENLSSLVSNLVVNCKELEDGINNSNKNFALHDILSRAESLVKTIKKLKKTKISPPTTSTIIHPTSPSMTTSTIGKFISTSTTPTFNDKSLFPNYRPRRNRKSNFLIKNSTDDVCCFQCGSKKTPEWRKGPDGSKSLCNACGLHYAKSKKKENELANQPIKNMSINNLINNS